MGLQLRGQSSLDSQASGVSEASTSSSSCSSSSSISAHGPHKCVAVLHSAGQSVHVVALALDGDQCLYAGSNNGEIREWSGLPPVDDDIQYVQPEEEEEEEEYQAQGAKFGHHGGSAAVKCLVVVDNQIISAHQDHKIRVWRRSKSQPQEHRLVSTLPSVKDYIVNFLPSKNYVQVRRHHKSLWINHNDSVSTLTVGNGVLYSGSWDKSVKVWRLSDFKCLESLTHHVDAVNALVTDNSSNLLFSGSGDTTINVYFHNAPNPSTTTYSKSTKRSHTLIATLQSTSAVNALALAQYPGLLYSAQSDKAVTAWKMSTRKMSTPNELLSNHDDKQTYGSAVDTLRGHRLAVLCVVTVSNLVISGSADKTVRVWRRASDGVHSSVSLITGHSGPVKSLCAAVDVTSTLVYSGSMDGDIRVWRIPDDQDHVDTDLMSSEYDGCSSSPDVRLVN